MKIFKDQPRKTFWALTAGFLALAGCGGGEQSSSSLQAADPGSLINAMRNQCKSSPSFIPEAALRRQMEKDSGASSVKWQPFSEEKHHIFAGDRKYAAQIAIGWSSSGQAIFRIYYTPQGVWNPVKNFGVGSDICSNVAVPPPPVIVVPPVKPPVTPPVIIVPPPAGGTLPLAMCGGGVTGSTPTCANFFGTDPVRGNIEAKGSCTQQSTHAFQVVSRYNCLVRCPQEVLHWGSGRFEGLPIFDDAGGTVYYVKKDGGNVAGVTLTKGQPNASVTATVCR